MTNFKGTKGKWVLQEDRLVNFGIYQGWAKISWGIGNSEPEANANALLISKAPEMLEMLESIEHKLRNGYSIQSSDHTKILQLIKEATEL